MGNIDKVAWILIENRKMLFVRSLSKNLFFTPGGKREGGETDQLALIREINEELKINLDPNTIEYVETFRDQAFGRPEGVMVEIKCYTARYSGTMKPSSEIEELAWLNSKNKELLTTTGKLIIDYLKDKNLID